MKVVVKPDFVGVVDRVYSVQKYALVRIGGVFPREGTTLISHSPEGADERVANLVVSPERLGNLRVPADIRSGAVETGDLVFVYKGLASPESREGKEEEKEDVSELQEEKSTSEKKGAVFPPGMPPGSDGLLPSSGGDEMPTHSPVVE